MGKKNLRHGKWRTGSAALVYPGKLSWNVKKWINDPLCLRREIRSLGKYGKRKRTGQTSARSRFESTLKDI